MPKRAPVSKQHKYQDLFETLKAEIVSGRYQPGQKLPSEAALVNRSGASRITVGRAVRELQNLGLVDRVAGSGTYVRDLAADTRPYLFGLIIPDLGETEIFDPICRGIANAPEAAQHALIWGHADAAASKPNQALGLCSQYISKQVSGVFFAPLEFEDKAERVNAKILSALREAGIPVVLLDRRTSKTPERRRPDLVGINNRQAGFIATEHLISLGLEHIAFLGYHGAAATIAEREAGYLDALAAHGRKPPLDASVHLAERGSVQDAELPEVEGFVCVNDRVAGQLMHVFLARKRKIPQDVRLVGIDDVSYASLLPVPLTTVRQPTREIGEAALRTMLDRIRVPNAPARDVLLDGELIVRQSCGATLSSPVE